MSAAAANYKPTPEDLRLERRLSRLLDDMERETDPLIRSRIWANYRDQHATRSKGFIGYMEQQKGLIK